MTYAEMIHKALLRHDERPLAIYADEVILNELERERRANAAPDLQLGHDSQSHTFAGYPLLATVQPGVWFRFEAGDGLARDVEAVRHGLPPIDQDPPPEVAGIYED